jgi:hypothetical protein
MMRTGFVRVFLVAGIAEAGRGHDISQSCLPRACACERVAARAGPQAREVAPELQSCVGLASKGL